MKHVFISYVREDADQVNFIKAILEEEFGITVWLDRVSLEAGQRWKHAIKKAIEDGAVFLACFSDNYYQKDSTYMNEELTTAIEQLRLKPYEKSWFIPVRLSNCRIPDRPIGAGEHLSDLQRVDLFEDFLLGIQKLAQLLLPIVLPQNYVKQNFGKAIDYHVNAKIKHFTDLGVPRFKQVEDRWLSLLEDNRLETILTTFYELYNRAQVTGRHELDRIIEPYKDGKVILLSVIPHQDVNAFMISLSTTVSDTNHKYSDFIIEKRREMRMLPNWEIRDFIHLLYFDGKDDLMFDILYMVNVKLAFTIFGYLMKKGGLKGNQGEKFMICYEAMYPTCLLSSIEAGNMEQLLLKEEAALGRPSCETA